MTAPLRGRVPGPRGHQRDQRQEQRFDDRYRPVARSVGMGARMLGVLMLLMLDVLMMLGDFLANLGGRETLRHRGAPSLLEHASSRENVGRRCTSGTASGRSAQTHHPN